MASVTAAYSLCLTVTQVWDVASFRKLSINIPGFTSFPRHVPSVFERVHNHKRKYSFQVKKLGTRQTIACKAFTCGGERKWSHKFYKLFDWTRWCRGEEASFIFKTTKPKVLYGTNIVPVWLKTQLTEYRAEFYSTAIDCHSKLFDHLSLLCHNY